MQKRVLTLVVEIEDKSEVLWLWHSRSMNCPINGVRIKSIIDGDYSELIDEYLCEDNHD